MRGRRQQAPIDEGSGHASCAAFFITGERRNLGPLDLAGDRRFPQDLEAAAQQALRAYLLRDMNLDPSQQRFGIQQAAHETNLVDRTVEKEDAEFDEAPLGEIAPTVTIALARPIGPGQKRRVTRLITRKPARDRPKPRPHIKPLEQSMRHQSRHPPIAVEEGMDPQEPVVHRTYRLDLAQFAQRWRLVCAIESRHEERKVAIRGRDVPVNFDIVLPPFAWDDRQLLAGALVGHPQHLRR